MDRGSQAYRAAELRLSVPDLTVRGSSNQNPEDIGFWELVAEDYRTHGRNLFEQGFWALFAHRFGNWRMGQSKLIRAPSTVIYWVMFKLVEWMTGISLWFPVKVGRRVRIWHHSGIVISARAIGDDVHLRQNVTIGVRSVDRLGELPIIESRVDIGAGAVIVGAVVVGQGARIGANAVVSEDVPPGAMAVAAPTQVLPPRGEVSDPPSEAAR
jgi:serine O-acetyltransferase